MTDPDLGDLVRRRGAWRGELAIAADHLVPLAVAGGRQGPDPAALALARTIPSTFAARRADIRTALAEHRAPYLDEEVDGGDVDHDPDPEPIYAAVIVLGGELTVELGYRVAWDEEHTLGARIRDGRLVELNGSVLEP